MSVFRCPHQQTYMIGSESESRQIFTSQTGKLRLTVLVLACTFLMPGESVVVTQPLEGNNQPMPLSVRTGIVMSWSPLRQNWVYLGKLRKTHTCFVQQK